MTPLRIAGLSWLVYVALSGAGAVLKNGPVSAIGSALYLLPMILVYRLFAPADQNVALLLLPIEGFACGLQAAGQLRDDNDMQKLALVVFALGFVVLGYLVARSGLLPAAVGYVMVAGAFAWVLAMVPGVPLPIARVLQASGFASEGLFVVWMVIAG